MNKVKNGTLTDVKAYAYQPALMDNAPVIPTANEYNVGCTFGIDPPLQSRTSFRWSQVTL